MKERLAHWARAPLLHFALLGGLLYLLLRLTTPPPPPAPIRLSRAEVEALENDWTRQTGRRPSEQERAALLRARADDELLLRQARALGWHRSDPVVQRRLIRNQHFLASDNNATGAGSAAGIDSGTTAEGDEVRESRAQSGTAKRIASDAVLLARAYEQGMDRSDIVVRRRLIERMRLAIEAGAHRIEPTHAELADTLSHHKERFSRPARIRFSQIFLSRDRRGAQLEHDAEQFAHRLDRDPPPPEAASSLGDPFLLSNTQPLSTSPELAARFGPTFADAAMKAPRDRWSGPVKSSYGLHFLWIREREPARLPSFEEVEPQVRALCLHEREQAAFRAYLAQLREGVEVRVESAPDTIASDY